VFEDSVLRKIFGRRIDEVTRDLKKLHNDELHNLFSLSSIIKMMTSRMMTLAWLVA
jgi:hypothetical protein